MDYYHFTAREYLPRIAQEVLRKGEVPLTAKLVRNGVWLTTDPDPTGHGLTHGRDVTDEEKAFLGVPASAKARFPDKRAIRFKVVIPESGGCLVHWPEWGRGIGAGLVPDAEQDGRPGRTALGTYFLA